jgi:hypothetical protein
LPIGVMHCFGRAMLSDRVTFLRKANVFEPHINRHVTSGLDLMKSMPAATVSNIGWRSCRWRKCSAREPFPSRAAS